MTKKTRNAADSTLRNTRAGNKRHDALKMSVVQIEERLADVERRLKTIEELPAPQKLL